MDLIRSTQPLRDRAWFGWLFGASAVAAAIWVRFAIGDAALRFPFVLFLPPVVLTTFLGGLRPGIAAAIVAGLFCDYSLIDPIGGWLPDRVEAWLALGFYVLTAGIDIALIHGITAAASRAEVAERDVRVLAAGLERHVAERTHALERQIAEREAAEDKVRHLQKMEAIGQLTGGIAHDFNNMLAIVIGSLDMAKRRAGDGNPKLLASLAAAKDGARRAAQLTERLLAFSRQQRLAEQPVDPNALIGGMADMLRRTLGEPVRLDVALASDAWPVLVDPGQLENAILNLAVNARDAMPHGGVLRIETANLPTAAHDAADGDRLVLRVADSGVGMPGEVVARAFDPFFTTKPVGRGTGLGLSQVYGFVSQSGGEVRIDSLEGEGTAVTLSLPRHTGPLSAAAPPSVAAALPTGSETILLVEDEDGLRRVTAEALEELGYAVVAVDGGAAAMSAINRGAAFHLLLTDVVMPQVDGPTLAAAARARQPDLPVLFTTGYARDAVLPEGSAAVLAKPFTLPQLAAKLREVLDGDTQAGAALASKDWSDE